MAYSEDDIKRIAELREWLEKAIAKKENEIEKLKFTRSLIDNLLKQTSFRPAVTLKGSEAEVRQLKSKDNVLMANAYVSENTLTIVPVSQLRFSISIPPFQSFFISRILEGMKNKDNERVKEGKLKSEEVISYNIEQENNIIRKIVISNYRDKERLNEVLNSATWVFTRMLEKIKA